MIPCSLFSFLHGSAVSALTAMVHAKLASTRRCHFLPFSITACAYSWTLLLSASSATEISQERDFISQGSHSLMQTVSAEFLGWTTPQLWIQTLVLSSHAHKLRLSCLIPLAWGQDNGSYNTKYRTYEQECTAGSLDADGSGWGRRLKFRAHSLQSAKPQLRQTIAWLSSVLSSQFHAHMESLLLLFRNCGLNYRLHADSLWHHMLQSQN